MNKAIHWIIVLNFLTGIAYSIYQIFFVFTPSGFHGPLGAAALTIDPQIFWARRAYALEAWIAISGLSIYLAIRADKKK